MRTASRHPVDRVVAAPRLGWTARRKQAVPYLLLLPVLVPIVALLLYPLVILFANSFQYYVLIEPHNRHFSGLENFGAVLSDEVFWRSLRNSLVWVLGSVSLEFLFGLVGALLVNQKFAGRALYRAVVLSPWAISGVLVAIIWRWMLHPQLGMVNDLLFRIGLIDQSIGWLTDPQLAMFSVIMTNVWRGIPFFVIMLLAGLQSIPGDLYEAAAIDGATSVRSFWHITLPLLKPVIAVSLLLRLIWTFNTVDLIFVMTGGGPINATQTLATYIFDVAYSQTNFGYGSALAVVLFLFMMAFTVLYFIVSKYGQGEDIL